MVGGGYKQGQLSLPSNELNCVLELHTEPLLAAMSELYVVLYYSR